MASGAFARVAVLLAGACVPLIAAPAEVQMAVDVGVGRTDNIGRVPDGGRSQTMGSVGLQFSVIEQTRRLNADVIGDLSWLDYADSDYSGEVNGSAVGRVGFALIPGRLQWVAEDRFGQTRQDLFSAPSPENRENVNHFATGPDLRLSLGASTDLLLGGRYALVDYEHSDADMRRWSAHLAVSRELAGGASLSGNVSGEKIEARRDNPAPDFDRSAAYLRYAVTGRRTTLNLDAGANRVEGGGIRGTGALLRMGLVRQLGRSSLSLQVGQEYTDAGSSLGLDSGSLDLPDSGAGTAEQSARPFTDRYVRAGWEITGRRTRIDLRAEWSDQDYEDAGSVDVQRASLGLGASRQLGPRTTLAARVRHELHDYDLAVVDNQETVYSLSASWDFARRLGLEVEGEHSVFDSDLTGAARETRYWLRLRYGTRVSR